MKHTTFALAAVAALAAAPALHAQSGFALKGHYVFNSSTVHDTRSSGFQSVPSPDGFSLGAEYVLPFGLGIGASAYAEGNGTDLSARSFQVGARLQLTSLLGIDGQYRHVSDAASKDQSPDLERNQFLLGVTLF
jgi:hypothetical protein